MQRHLTHLLSRAATLAGVAGAAIALSVPAVLSQTGDCPDSVTIEKRATLPAGASRGQFSLAEITEADLPQGCEGYEIADLRITATMGPGTWVRVRHEAHGETRVQAAQGSTDAFNGQSPLGEWQLAHSVQTVMDVGFLIEAAR